MDPEVTWSNTHYYDCVNNGVAEHECQFSGCSRSIWMCVVHKDDPTNAAVISKLKEAMIRQGWTLGMVSVMRVPSTFNSLFTNIQEEGQGL